MSGMAGVFPAAAVSRHYTREKRYRSLMRLTFLFII